MMLRGCYSATQDKHLASLRTAKKATFSHIWPHLATYFLFLCGLFALLQIQPSRWYSIVKVQMMLMNRDGIGSIYVYCSTFVLFVVLVFEQARFELGDIPLEAPLSVKLSG
jgi:polyferredoxin